MMNPAHKPVIVQLNAYTGVANIVPVLASILKCSGREEKATI